MKVDTEKIRRHSTTEENILNKTIEWCKCEVARIKAEYVGCGTFGEGGGWNISDDARCAALEKVIELFEADTQKQEEAIHRLEYQIAVLRKALAEGK